MSEIRPQPGASSAATPQEPERGQGAGVPEPSRVESWLRTLAGFENVRVAGVEPLSDGLSNVTCRLKVSDGPVSTAVLRIQPTGGIFEPYDVLREGRVLSHLAGAAVPVPGLLAAESDPGFFGSPFLLLESIDAAHMPAPEADFATFAADLPAFAAAVAGIHALDWKAAGLGFLGVPSSPAGAFRGEVETVARRMHAFGCADEPLLNGSAFDRFGQAWASWALGPCGSGPCDSARHSGPSTMLMARA